MNLKHIKLIASDMDGTLLDSNHNLSQDFYKVYEKLKEKNILFVPASGRQHASITKYFEPIKNDLFVIAENGCFVTKNNEEVFSDSIDFKLVEDIIQITRKIKGANLVLAGKKYAYVESNDEAFLSFFKNFYENNIVVDNLLDIKNEQIVKIAIQHNDGSEKNLYPFVKEFEKYDLKVVVSGEVWLDIMNKNTNKGLALSQIMKKLNLNSDEVVVFGDYMNDIEMMQLSNHSVAMENAHADVKNISNYVTQSNDNSGVIQFINTHILK